MEKTRKAGGARTAEDAERAILADGTNDARAGEDHRHP